MRHELLRRHRAAPDCLFTLWVAFGAGPAHNEIDFTEYYDYAPRPGDAGREYAYSIYAPETDLPRLVETLARHAGTTPDPDPRTALPQCLRTLIELGELGDHLAIEQNVRTLRTWLDEAGIGHREDRWSWFNSD